MAKIEGTKKYWEEKGKLDLRKNKPLTPVASGHPSRSITIDLTKKCNLRCDYCFTNLSKGQYHAPDLTFEMGKKIIDWGLEDSTNGGANKVDFTFWGGEPLLKWDMIKELVVYAEEAGKKKGIKVGFNGTTNVTLLTPEKFDFMDEHGLHFLLSVDGIKEHHDAHRKFANGKGSFDTVNKNIDAILERWPWYQVRVSYSTETIESFLEDVKFLYERGFTNIAYSPVCEGDWNDQKVLALHDTWGKVADWWMELKKQNKQPRIKYMDDFLKKLFVPEGNRPPCGAARNYIGVTTDGAIYPCHRFNKFNDPRPWYEREVCLGHIDYGILNQEWRQNFIKWDINTHMKDSCKDCEAFEQYCSGGCWASNWDLEDALHGTPTASCETTLANIKNAKKILKEMPELEKEYNPKKRRTKTNKKIHSKSSANIPLVQGCECYNAEDILYGRKIVNKHDDSSCLCNMAVYGKEPEPITGCDCYNVEDSFISQYDKTGSMCKEYSKKMESETIHKCKPDEDHDCQCKTKDPVKEAIKHLKEENTKLETLDENQKKDIMELGKLMQQNAELKDRKQD